MRETKFRGKSDLTIEELEEAGVPHKNGWIVGNLIGNEKLPVIVGPIVDCSDEYFNTEWWASVIPETVGQYTGLKGYLSDEYEDSEEKGVYQGDSITIFQESLPAGYYLEEYITGIVDLDETGTAFIIKNAEIESLNENIPRNDGDMEISLNVPSDEDLKEVFLHHFDLTPDDVTINGNIYDNPELLEEEK